MTQNIPHDLRLALWKTAAALEPEQSDWLLGGSCGLLLQGVELGRDPRDIDIYTDSCHVSALHNKLRHWAAGDPEFDREGMYESLLAKYELDRYPLELVGGFKVASGQSRYRVEVDGLLGFYAMEAVLEGNGSALALKLMPLAHELVFNVLRDRPDRYEPIARAIRRDKTRHTGLLERILERNDWDSGHRTRISALTGT